MLTHAVMVHSRLCAWAHRTPTRMLEQRSLEMRASHPCIVWPLHRRAVRSGRGVPVVARWCIEVRDHEAQLHHCRQGKAYSKYDVAEPWFHPNLPDRSLGGGCTNSAP